MGGFAPPGPPQIVASLLMLAFGFAIIVFRAWRREALRTAPHIPVASPPP